MELLQPCYVDQNATATTVEQFNMIENKTLIHNGITVTAYTRASCCRGIPVLAMVLRGCS